MFFRRKVSVFGFSGHEESDFKEPFTRLDPTVSLENIISYLAIGFMVAGTILMAYAEPEQDLELVKALSLIAVFLSITRIFTDCTYVLDNTRKILYYSFSILGFTSTYKVCHFAEIKRVGTEVTERRARSRSSWVSNYYLTYTIVLEIENSICFKVSREDNEYERTTNFAQRLAEHLEADFAEPLQNVSTLRSNNRTVPMEEAKLDWNNWYQSINPTFYELGLFATCLALSISIFYR